MRCETCHHDYHNCVDILDAWGRVECNENLQTILEKFQWELYNAIIAKKDKEEYDRCMEQCVTILKVQDKNY